MELDLCCVETTDLIREAVEHVLNWGGCEEELKEDLLQWPDDVPGGREGKQGEADYSWVEGSVIPFQLVVRIHQQLKVHPLGWCFGLTIAEAPNPTCTSNVVFSTPLSSHSNAAIKQPPV